MFFYKFEIKVSRNFDLRPILNDLFFVRREYVSVCG
jgi:hypothetical protein